MEYLNNLLNSNTQSGGVYGVSMHQLNQILQLSSAYFNRFDDNTKQQYIKLFGFTPLSLLKGHSSSKMPQYRERFIFLIYLQFIVLLMMNNTVGMSEHEVLEYLRKLCKKFNIDINNPICSRIRNALSGISSPPSSSRVPPLSGTTPPSETPLPRGNTDGDNDGNNDGNNDTPDNNNTDGNDTPDDDNNILLMFLGALPNKDDEHYNKFFKTKNSKCFIIVHPFELNNYYESYIENNEIYKELYNNKQLLIVDSNHHVKTKWATNTLVYAVLLMMQYSLIKKGNIFKKFVLISSNDKPLYNFDIIYKTLTQDNCSWIYYSGDNNGYKRYFLKSAYEFEGGIFDTDDIVYSSQWMAIDKEHLKYFINLNNDFKTYEKKNKIFTCDNNSIEIIDAIDNNSTYSKYLNSFNGSYNEEMTEEELKNILKNESGFCIGIDEFYFASVIKHNLKTKEEFKKNIKYNTISNLNEINKYQFIKPLDSEDYYLEEYQTVYSSSLNTNITTNDYRTWYGGSPKFGEFKYYIQIIKNKQPKNEDEKYFIIKNNKIIKLSQDKLDKFKNNKNYNELTGGSYDKYGNDDYVSFENNSNNFICDDIYTLSTTYTDWSIVNVNPSNMFRDFKIETFDLNDFPDKNILNFINSSEINVLINYINTNKNKNNINYNNNNNDYVKGPSYHPIEYTTYNLLSIINSYNLIIFLNIYESQNGGNFYNDYLNAKNIYENIIKNNMLIIKPIIINNKTYYTNREENSLLEEFKTKLYGHPITSFSLNNALSYGSLFIRKTMDNSLIEKYTDSLMNLENYVLDNYSNYNKRDLKYLNKDKIIFNNLEGGSYNNIDITNTLQDIF